MATINRGMDPKHPFGGSAPISLICGVEPLREREYPTIYKVGDRAHLPDDDDKLVVTAITFREDYFGDHSLCWFDVFAGERLIASMSARHVSEVQYGASAEESDG